MTGYQPDTGPAGPRGRRVRRPDTTSAQRPGHASKATRAGVYLAGVIVAGMHTSEIFIENGRFHGAQIAADIAAKLGAR